MSPAARMLPLFLVSGCAIGIEIALTRYFAVAKWSEYGYWVISIVMAGFALSGVVMALARDWFARRGPLLLQVLPALLILAGAGGYWLTASNPFNPLQLQNAATATQQLWNIAGYYGALLPFFFLAGVFVSLCFVLNADRVARVYAWDLTGAGAGAALVLALMAVVHPFLLVPALLPLLALAALTGRRPLRAGGAALLALALAEGGLLLSPQAAYNDFKAIYAPSNVPDSRVVAEVRSPRGLYALLDDFTERLDTDVSNNAGLMNLPGPPSGLGLYRDGNRIATLPKAEGASAAYAPAALDSLPYLLRPGARVLLAGSGGGFRIAETLALGARSVTALEPDPVIRGALLHGLGSSPALAGDPRVIVLADSPLAAARRAGGFDVIDVSGDFLDAGEANATAFTADALQAELRALAPGGVVSLPVSIREFPVYATRVLATVREALLGLSVASPEQHVVVYRSAWTVRILLSRDPWGPARLAEVRRFCDERSFDVSYLPGLSPSDAKAEVFNDLPPVSFTTGEVSQSAEAQDAVADEAGPILRGERVPSADAFDLRPATLDRPAFYSVLRLDQLGVILPRLELLPQGEIGGLVNVAVLAQAVVVAALVLLVPVFAPRVTNGRGAVLRPALYFAALGIGFLFIEIALIERASLLLNDRTSAFALVLTGMLVFGGLGSLLAGRVRGIALPAAFVVLWCAAFWAFGDGLVLAALDLPWAARAVVVVLLLAPVSLALGLPFPLGLDRVAASGGGFLPWAWGLNGAFSVVATPLANLVALQGGTGRVLLCAAVLYGVAWITFPHSRTRLAWHPLPTT